MGPGLLLGIELLDFSDQRIYRAGDTSKTFTDSEVKTFELKKGERLIGVRYGRREWPTLCFAYDV